MTAVTLFINGKRRTVIADPAMPLLWALRDVVGLTGTKFGCGIAQCGACTVHLDGAAVRSCSLPVSAARRQDDHHDRGPVARPELIPCSRRGSNSTCPNAATASRARSCRRPRCSASTPQAHRRGHRRRDGGQHLPLRHLPAHPRSDPPRGRGGVT